MHSVNKPLIVRNIVKKPTVLIIGAGGLVGINLIERIGNKYAVVAVDKNQGKIDLIKKLFPNTVCICEDINRENEWRKHCAKAKAVIALQAQISSQQYDDYVKNNIDSVNTVLDACKKTKHLIHLSSSVAISVTNDPYAKTKRDGEKLVLKSKVPHTVFRPPLMYGCFDYKHLAYLTKIIEISPVFPVPGSGKYIRQPLYVVDLCDVIISSIEKGPTLKVHNIIGKERIYFLDLLKIIARERKLKRVFVNIPLPIFAFMLKTYTTVLGKAPFVKDQLLALIAGDIFPVGNWEKEFGVKYTPFVEGIRKTIRSNYYKYRVR